MRERTAELETSHARLGESMAQLSSAKGELEIRVNELATAHNQLVQAEKLQAVGQLAAGIAHEINTPVQFIADSLHFLKEGLVGYQKLVAQYRCAEKQHDGRPSSEAACEKIRTAMTEGSAVFERVHRRLDGQVFPPASF